MTYIISIAPFLLTQTSIIISVFSHLLFRISINIKICSLSISVLIRVKNRKIGWFYLSLFSDFECSGSLIFSSSSFYLHLMIAIYFPSFNALNLLMVIPWHLKGTIPMFLVNIFNLCYNERSILDRVKQIYLYSIYRQCVPKLLTIWRLTYGTHTNCSPSYNSQNSSQSLILASCHDDHIFQIRNWDLFSSDNFFNCKFMKSFPEIKH